MGPWDVGSGSFSKGPNCLELPLSVLLMNKKDGGF